MGKPPGKKGGRERGERDRSCERGRRLKLKKREGERERGREKLKWGERKREEEELKNKKNEYSKEHPHTNMLGRKYKSDRPKQIS